jgi:hypothetical protein
MLNKVTKLFPEGGAVLNEAAIQAHFDELNEDGWSLVAVDNMVGWYRFFWSKENA